MDKIILINQENYFTVTNLFVNTIVSFVQKKISKESNFTPAKRMEYHVSLKHLL